MTHPPPPLVSRPPGRMPDQISVSEFIAETTEDYNSPTTSSFTTRLHNCRNTVTLLEEVGRAGTPAVRARRCRRAAGGSPLGAGRKGTRGPGAPHPLRQPPGESGTSGGRPLPHPFASSGVLRVEGPGDWRWERTERAVDTPGRTEYGSPVLGMHCSALPHLRDPPVTLQVGGVRPPRAQRRSSAAKVTSKGLGDGQ